jgi:HK97 family phage major capsid protein
MAEVTKEMLDDLNKNVNEFRNEFKKMEEGSISKSTFEAFKAQIGPDIIALKTAVARPAQEVPPGSEHKDDGSGKAEYRKAFYNGLRGKEFNFEGKAAQYAKERKALVADATGQILIPEELESEVIRALPALNVMRSLCTTRQTTSNRVRRRSLTEVTGGWGKLELGGSPTETTPVPTEQYSYVEDWNGLTKVGKDELMDSDQNIEAILADSFSRAIADDEEDAFINGTGHTFQQPEGILLAASGVTCVANAAAGAVTFEDILALMYATPAQYRRNGTFIMHSGTELLLAQLRETATGGNGPFLWQPSPAIGQPSTIWGRPVYNCETMPQVGDGTLQKVIIFGDLRAGYRILDRVGISIQRLTELYAGSGLVGLLANKRTTGSVIRADALRIMQEHA